MDPTASAGRQPHGDVRPRGEPTRGPRRRGQQSQQQQCADRLCGKGGGGADQREEPDAEWSHPHPARRRDGRVEGREQQRPADDNDQADQRCRQQRSSNGLPQTEPEDRAEQHAHASGTRLRRMSSRRVDGQRENAEPEHPREDCADHDVVGTAATPEQAQHDSDRDRRAEQAPAAGRCRTPSAPSAPVNATWLSASPVKTWLRSTMK